MTDPGGPVFVTGGTGFIGSRVVERLCAAGREVRCLVRSTGRAARLAGLPVELVCGDLDSRDALARGFEDTASCIHLAGISAWDRLEGPELERVIVEGTRSVLAAARDAGSPRLVVVSSVVAVGGSREPVLMDESSCYNLHATRMRYAHAKHAAEKISANFVEQGLDVVMVNPVETYGENDVDMVTAGNLVDFVNNWPCLVTRGGTAIAGVGEVADGIVAALARGRRGERYILGGDNLSFRELAQLTLELAGRRAPVVGVPLGLLRIVVPLLARFGLPTPVAPELLHYLGYYFYVDCRKAVDELGYQPLPARSVLEPVVKWLRDNGHVAAA